MTGTTTETYTGTIVYETITNTGNYVITADGATGGSSRGNPSGLQAGGAGEDVSATFFLQAGDVLEIVVGGAGKNALNGFNVGGGGGGGSFVYDKTTGILLEAAGGGGGATGADTTGSGGSGVTLPGNGSGGQSSVYYGSLGYLDSSSGGGGGGINGNGAANADRAGGGAGGILPTTGGAGYASFAGAGGFGGGGGGGEGGGGGGGFTGGNGGDAYNYDVTGGGGGSSYVNPIGTNASYVASNTSGNGSVGISLTLACFASGTAIRTPSGDVPIETLAPGDLVTQTDGTTAPVVWLGIQTVSTVFGDRLRVLPIRITAGALGENIPQRDMLISPDHALFIDNILVQAGALVNGETIFRETNVPEIFTYYHVELPTHALMLAENTPVESFIDNVDRLAFDNWAEHEEKGALQPLQEMAYPRVKSARQLPAALRHRFNRPAAA